MRELFITHLIFSPKRGYFSERGKHNTDFLNNIKNGYTANGVFDRQTIYHATMCGLRIL